MVSKIIFIVGPTATGKTQVGYLLAKKIGGQIISCDSTLVYREPKIITSKPPSYMLKEIPHHFVDIISVETSYDVFTYYLEAREVIRDLWDRGVPIVVCGGSGLYFQAILDGIFEGAGSSFSLREKLRKEADIKGNLYLYNKLKEVDPQGAERISSNDLKRIIRALEVYYTTGEPISQRQKKRWGIWSKYPVKIFGFFLRRNLLYEVINWRTEEMFKKGAVKEVSELIKLNLSITAKKIIGIKEIKSFLEGNISLDEAKEAMKRNTRRFAKRQFTWFNREKRLEWIDVEDKTSSYLVEYILRNVRNSKN
ncbi:MAG: tRNA (adenosine(37)-N6)-dimethylallyltransferase MiaA [Candidatus Omnitrophota bacterium]|nr:MAG: tRNA (adenosine(37)-N6)-dimethylallyltransferase MiaA [Candidatus Omnitrophota bacterium]HDN85704.1 tRNA (adenosine(37)-N6)-dimethylallyltransferase MiaA [Candidatus Omnitrophota bacterium]